MSERDETGVRPEEAQDAGVAKVPLWTRGMVTFACIMAAVVVAAVVFVAFQCSDAVARSAQLAQAVGQSTDATVGSDEVAEGQTVAVSVNLSAAGYDAATSSKAVVHVAGTDEDGATVSFDVRDVDCNKDVVLDKAMKHGTYTVTVTTLPVLADGTLFTAPATATTLKIDDKTGSKITVSITLTAVPVSELTDEQIAAAGLTADQVATVTSQRTQATGGGEASGGDSGSSEGSADSGSAGSGGAAEGGDDTGGSTGAGEKTGHYEYVYWYSCSCGATFNSEEELYAHLDSIDAAWDAGEISDAEANSHGGHSGFYPVWVED